MQSWCSPRPEQVEKLLNPSTFPQTKMHNYLYRGHLVEISEVATQSGFIRWMAIVHIPNQFTVTESAKSQDEAETLAEQHIDEFLEPVLTSES